MHTELLFALSPWTTDPSCAKIYLSVYTSTLDLFLVRYNKFSTFSADLWHTSKSKIVSWAIWQQKTIIKFLNYNTSGLLVTNCRLQHVHSSKLALVSSKRCPTGKGWWQEVRKLAAPVLAHHIRSDQMKVQRMRWDSRGSNLRCDMKDNGLNFTPRQRKYQLGIVFWRYEHVWDRIVS